MKLQAAIGEVTRHLLTGYTEAVVVDAPTSYYRLGEPSGTTAVDARGVQNGTYTNGPTLGVVGAVSLDTAVTFASASSQYVTIPDLAAHRPGLNNFSTELWVKRNGNPSASEFLLNKGDSSSNGYELFVNSQGRAVSRIGSIQLTSLNVVTDNAWHHIVVSMTRAGNGVMYVDGSAEVTTSISSQSALNLNSTGALELGRRPSGNYFTGSLDEVAIYIGAALTAAQVASRFTILMLQQVVTQGTGSPESVVTAPVGSLYQRRDGGAGTSFYVKESGTGNTGWVAK